MSQNSILANLIFTLSTLPGLGPKSAKRAVLHMIKNDSKMMRYVAELLLEVAEKIKRCSLCNNVDVNGDICTICADDSRDQKQLCVVETIADLWNVENSQHYKGLYYVLDGSISSVSMAEIGPKVQHLINYTIERNFQEIILATNPTMSGQTTALYVAELIKEEAEKNNQHPQITSLGRGVPIGSELDYLDESTIGAAFKSRKEVDA